MSRLYFGILRYIEFLTSQLHDVMTGTGSFGYVFLWPHENWKSGASRRQKRTRKALGSIKPDRHPPPDAPPTGGVTISILEELHYVVHAFYINGYHKANSGLSMVSKYVMTTIL